MARQHATTADFALVGMSVDPTPGDPDAVQAVVTRYADIGDAARRASDDLKKDGALSTGRGAAMDALRDKVGDDLPDKLSKTATSYNDAANAYKAYLPQLEEAQDTFDRAVEQARTAAPQANQTAAKLPADATDDQKAAHSKQQQDIDAAQDSMSAARSLAEQARSMREAAANTCANALDSAAGEAIPARNLFQKISDFFEDFPFVKILLGALLAILTIFFPVVGLLLGAAFLAISTIADIASGHFNLGDLLVGLLSLVPGGALLKLAGSGIKAGLSLGAKIAPQLAKTAKGGLNGIKASLNSSKTIGSSAGKAVKAAAGNFGEGAAEEAASEAADGQPLDAKSILGAGAAGLLGSGGKKGGKVPTKNSPGTGSRGIDDGPPTGPPVSPALGPRPDAPHIPTRLPGQLPANSHFPQNSVGGIDLVVHEANTPETPLGQGTGHAIIRHAGRTPAQLDERLFPPGGGNGITASSTFHSLESAEHHTSENIAAHASEIDNFLHLSQLPEQPQRLTITHPIPPNAGSTHIKGSGGNAGGFVLSSDVSNVTTVLKRDDSTPGGLGIVTSFPGR